jgi:hypothetical protein
MSLDTRQEKRWIEKLKIIQLKRKENQIQDELVPYINLLSCLKNFPLPEYSTVCDMIELIFLNRIKVSFSSIFFSLAIYLDIFCRGIL